MRRLIVGIGSPHGADQIGWSVVEQLQKRRRVLAECRNVVKPVDLLDLLSDFEELIVIDAVQGMSGDLVERWTWPSDQLKDALSSGTHGFGLIQVLELAQELRLLPGCVTIIGVSVENSLSVASLSPTFDDSIAKVIKGVEALYA
jgi:hydrogenase maturation protease